MARSIEDIQRDIERNRNQLARTLDEISVRTNPKNVADDAKTRLVDGLKEPTAQGVWGVVPGRRRGFGPCGGMGKVMGAPVALGGAQSDLLGPKSRRNTVQVLICATFSGLHI